MKTTSLFLLLCLFSPMPGQSVRKEAMATGCYSNCVVDAHRSFGMSITVMYSISGYWVLFQSCEGNSHDPILVKGNYDGSVFSFTIPDTKDGVGLGTFHGFPGPTELTGRFDRKPDEKVRIPKIGNYQ